jgi:hypothetical protein
MFYYGQYLMRNQEHKNITNTSGTTNFTVEGIPPQVWQEYDLNIIKGSKRNNYWLLESAKGNLALWKYTGFAQKLERALAWREYLRQPGFNRILQPVKTNKGRNYVECEKGCFYITEWYNGTSFNGQKNEDLIELSGVLAELHRNANDFNIEKIDEANFSWLKVKQDRLTDLLFYYKYLNSKRLINDFERLYVENFEDIYNRGQEAIEKMIMAGYDPSNQSESTVLVRNFLDNNILKTEKAISAFVLFTIIAPFFYQIDLPVSLRDKKLQLITRRNATTELNKPTAVQKPNFNCPSPTRYTYVPIISATS